MRESVVHRGGNLAVIFDQCPADIENDGHRFGEDLPDPDKKALIAFLATL